MLLSFAAYFFTIKTGSLSLVLQKIVLPLKLNLKHMNWPAIIIVGIILLALVVFLVKRNIKDEKEVEQQLKNDYPKPKEEGDEEENIEEMK
jgi:flagellar biosynthesis/type III secretory pathway M-ring protein FliF/YscJ